MTNKKVPMHDVPEVWADPLLPRRLTDNIRLTNTEIVLRQLAHEKDVFVTNATSVAVGMEDEFSRYNLIITERPWLTEEENLERNHKTFCSKLVPIDTEFTNTEELVADRLLIGNSPGVFMFNKNTILDASGILRKGWFRRRDLLNKKNTK